MHCGLQVPDITSRPSLTSENSASSESSNASADGASRAPTPSLNNVKLQLQHAIALLGGTATPKLNWSAPTDATWISAKGLQCHNADEVLLLLMSSDRVAHDADTLRQMLINDASSIQELSTRLRAASAVEPCIVLRKHMHLAAGREFRCFVRHSSLVAISQRDVTQHCPDVCAEESSIRNAICSFMAAPAFKHFPLLHCAIPALSVTRFRKACVMALQGTQGSSACARAPERQRSAFFMRVQHVLQGMYTRGSRCECQAPAP